MLVDKTKFGLALYNHANFYQFEETSSYWSVKRISVFLCFSLVNQRHTSGITTYNRTVTKTLCGPCIAAIAGSRLLFIRLKKEMKQDVSHDVAVIQWITLCHKNHMTRRVTSLTTSVSAMRFVIEIMLILKAIKFDFKRPYDKQNLIRVVISY